MQYSNRMIAGCRYPQAYDTLTPVWPHSWLIAQYLLTGCSGVPVDAFRWGGYCHHGNCLFPTWHRAYVQHLENALRTQVCRYDTMQDLLCLCFRVYLRVVAHTVTAAQRYLFL